MVQNNIAVIRGDGIGIEVVEEGIKVLEAVSENYDFQLSFQEFPWSSQYYMDTGAMMPSDGLDTLSAFEAIFLGAVGHPDIQDHITLNGLLLPIRRKFDQYVCADSDTDTCDDCSVIGSAEQSNDGDDFE